MLSQLDMFQNDPVLILMEKMEKVIETSEKVRKSIYARVNELEKMVIDMQKEKKKDD